jgi:hypothetical protein
MRVARHDRQVRPNFKTKAHDMNAQKTMDSRSVLAGFVMGAIAVLCLGAALRHGNQPGRFLLGVGEGQTAYVIDTVSGQVWQKDDHNRKEFFGPKAEERDFESRSAAMEPKP